MDAVKQFLPLLIKLSVATLVFSVALEATLSDVTSVIRRPAALLKAIVAVNLVTPIVGAILIAIFPLNPDSKAALMFMAVSPVPPFVPAKSVKLGRHKEYALGVYAALVVLSVVIVPAMVSILAHFYGVQIVLGVAKIARNQFLIALLPLGLGIAVHRLAPSFAKRFAPLIGKLALVLVVCLPIIVLLGSKMAGLIGDGTILAAVIMVVAALIAGHLLGGPDIRDRATLAITAATRHPGISLMIAGAAAASKLVSAAVIVVFLAGLGTTIVYQVWVKRRLAREGAGSS